MSLRGIQLKDIELSNLESMVENNMSESIDLEFKEKPWGVDHNGKKEMLKDVSAMANAYGGYIILGIREENHCAVELVGFEDAYNIKDNILRSCRANIEETLIGLDASVLEVLADASETTSEDKENESVDENDRKHVIVIFVPESHNKPHMINYDKHQRFYRRSSTDNNPMSVREIKDMVLFEDIKSREVEQFCSERLENLLIKYKNETKVVMSIFPNRFRQQKLELTRKQLFDYYHNERSQTQLKLHLDEPVYFLNGISFNYFINDDVLLTNYDVYNNGYIEYIADYNSFVDITNKGGMHPTYIIMFLLNGLQIVRKIEEMSPFTSIYFLNLRILYPQYFCMLEERGRAESTWEPKKFSDTEFEISSTYEIGKDNNELIVSKIMGQFYKAFNIPHCRYFDEEHRIIDKHKNHIYNR